MRDEAAVSKFLLEFSLTTCRLAYCSRVSGIPGLLMWRMALSQAHTQHRAVIFSASFLVFTSTPSLVLHMSTSLSIYVIYSKVEPHSIRVNRVCLCWIAGSIHKSSQPDHATDPGFVSSE